MKCKNKLDISKKWNSHLGKGHAKTNADILIMCFNCQFKSSGMKQDVPLTFIRRCFLVGYGCLDVASTLLFDGFTVEKRRQSDVSFATIKQRSSDDAKRRYYDVKTTFLCYLGTRTLSWNSELIHDQNYYSDI